MNRNLEVQRIRKYDFIPVFGLTSYAIRIFAQLEEKDRRKDLSNLIINSASLFAYNLAVGMGLDRLFGTDYIF